MKKTLVLLLSLLMVCSLAACNKTNQEATTPVQSSDSPTQATEASAWSRQGYFSDEEGHFLSVMLSDDESNPGWYVSCMIEEGWYGGVVQQEGENLHGNIHESESEENQFVVTVSEEGEDGLQLELQDGKIYHFTPYEMQEASIVVYVNIEGFGQVAYAHDGDELAFDDEYPSQSAYIGLAEPETYVLGAKPDEGWKFMKWTKDGEEYSKDSQITVELTESANFVAVFGIRGTNEEHVDLEAVTTIGELLGLPNYGTSYNESRFAYGFEQDGEYYRAVAELPQDVSEALFRLDFEDEQYDEKFNALVSPLKVEKIDNLSEGIPTQEELDKLVGKTGEDLMNEGWSCFGWNWDDMVFSMSHEAYEYDVVFEGEITNMAEFEEEDIKPLVVKSVKFSRIGDHSWLEEMPVE